MDPLQQAMQMARAADVVGQELLKHHPLYGSEPWREAMTRLRAYEPMPYKQAHAAASLERYRVHGTRYKHAGLSTACLAIAALLFVASAPEILRLPMLIMAGTLALAGVAYAASSILHFHPMVKPLGQALRGLTQEEAADVRLLVSESREAYEVVDAWYGHIEYLRAVEYSALRPLIRLLKDHRKSP